MKIQWCATCMWWDGPYLILAGAGRCHRHAPLAKEQNGSGDMGSLRWPITAVDDFCGDWTRDKDDGRNAPLPSLAALAKGIAAVGYAIRHSTGVPLSDEEAAE